MQTDPKARDYEICACRHVTRGQVEDIAREKHITDLKTLCEVANVGNKCGGCREMLDELLQEIKQESL